VPLPGTLRKHFKLQGTPTASLLIFAAIALSLFIAYRPVFTEEFVFNDDVLISQVRNGDCRTHPHFNFFFVTGRFFMPLLLCPLYSWVKTINDLGIFRFMTVGMFAIAAFFFCRWLQKNSINAIQSILITVTIFVMPPFQAYLVFASHFSTALGVVASLGAARLSWRGAQGMTDTWRSVLNRTTLFAVILSFFSMGFYTPLCTFYFAAIAVPLIRSFPSEGLRIRKALYLFGVFFTAAALYFVLAKLSFEILTSLLQLDKEMLGGHRVAIVTSKSDVVWKIPLFFNALYLAFNLWQNPPSTQMPWVVATVLLLGTAAGAVNLWRKEKQFARTGSVILLKGIVILSLFPLALLPNLAAQFFFLAYRFTSALYALTIVTLFFAIQQMSSAFLGKRGNFAVGLIFLFFAVIGVQKAQANIKDYFIAPSQAELKLLRSTFEERDLEKVRNIHVNIPTIGNFLGAAHNLPTCDDEFGVMTSTYKQVVPGLVRFVLKEFGLAIEEMDRIKISGGTYQNGLNNAQTLVIDMDQLNRDLYSKYVLSIGRPDLLQKLVHRQD
jgi:hypothetical protein